MTGEMRGAVSYVIWRGSSRREEALTSFRDLQSKHHITQQKDKRPQNGSFLWTDLVQDGTYRQRRALQQLLVNGAPPV